MAFPAFLTAALLFVASTEMAVAQERYVGAAVDDLGNLRIAVANGHQISVPPDRPAPDDSWKQVGFSKIALAANGQAVGWIALFSDCGGPRLLPGGDYCPAISLKLVVYENGRTHQFGDGAPIWKWTFLSGGTQVGLMRMTLHGADAEAYELREVLTGRLLASYELDIVPNGAPSPTPEWVKVVARQR